MQLSMLKSFLVLVCRECKWRGITQSDLIRYQRRPRQLQVCKFSFIDCAWTYLISTLPAERGLNDHHHHVHNVLNQLLTATLTDNKVHADILCRVFGTDSSVNFSKQILDLQDNPHLRALVKQGVRPVVYETRESNQVMARSVLKPIDSQDQEDMLNFLGM